MSIMKTTAFAGLLSLTLTSAIFAAGDPIVQDQVQYQYSNLNSTPVANAADAPQTIRPQVTSARATTAARQPNVVQTKVVTASNTQPVARVARRPASKPATASLLTLGENDNIVELVNNARGVVLIDFYADWCAPCRKQGKILNSMERTASKLNASIIKVNIDKHRELAAKLSVKSLPTILIVKDGLLIKRESGVAERDRVKALLSL